MATFGEPPDVDVLRGIGPSIIEVAELTLLWRIYKRGGLYPVRWDEFRVAGPPNSRFDHRSAIASSALAPRGIYYAAVLAPTCVAEYFQATRFVDRSREEPWLVSFRLARPLRLLDLSGSWPTRAGVSMAINSGEQAIARRWSQSIHEAYPDVEGLWYPSAMHGTHHSIALYERGSPAMPAHPESDLPLRSVALDVSLRNAATEFGYGIDVLVP